MNFAKTLKTLKQTSFFADVSPLAPPSSWRWAFFCHWCVSREELEKRGTFLYLSQKHTSKFQKATDRISNLLGDQWFGIKIVLNSFIPQIEMIMPLKIAIMSGISIKWHISDIKSTHWMENVNPSLGYHTTVGTLGCNHLPEYAEELGLWWYPTSFVYVETKNHLV